MDECIREAFAAVHAEERFKKAARAAVTAKRRDQAATKIGMRRYLALAAVCLVVMLVGGGWVYATPTASIEIQADPSLELMINRFDRVVEVRGCNAVGDEMAAGLSVAHCHYEEAVEQILRSPEMSALLARGEDVAIVVSGQDTRQCEQMLSCMETCVSGNGIAHCYRKGWQRQGSTDQTEDVSKQHGYGQGHGHHGGRDR